ncbi:MAG: DUF308 domain-containing protein [Clostridia bacterium]|nr:DUF308 domain-containing protein [Clostridia bacterium]
MEAGTKDEDILSKLEDSVLQDSAPEEDATEEERLYLKYGEDTYLLHNMAEEEAEKSESAGDNMIELLSAEAYMGRVLSVIHMPEHVLTYIFAILYAAFGIVCIATPSTVIDFLAYVVGGVLVLIGVVQFISAVMSGEYKQTKTNTTATSILIAGIGVLFICQQATEPESETAVILISILWAVLGLFEVAHLLNHAFKRIANSERFVYYVIKAIIELIVSFTLLWDPSNSDAHEFHIIMFGVSLLIEAVTMIPQIKAIVTAK